MKVMRYSVALLATLLMATTAIHADEYQYDNNQENWGDTAENVFTHVFALPEILTIDSVSIDLSHSFASDIDFTLTSPTGDVFDLTSDLGGLDDLGDGGSLLAGTSNYVFVEADGNGTWSDAVNNPIPGGTYDAESWFSAGWAAGNWTLTLDDDADGSTGASGSVIVSFTPVPEPSSMLLLLGGVGAMTFVRRRKK